MEINPYSTHLELINRTFNFIGKQNNVIEFGMGHFSTNTLLTHSVNLTSIEMQSEEWYNKMVKELSHNKNWTHYKLIDPHEYRVLKFGNIDFALSDGHGSSRPCVVNDMIKINVPVIVAHDTEDSYYGWHNINLPSNYKSFTHKQYKPWTTIYSSNLDLIKYLEKDLS
jgi:hypothetical protein